MKSAVSIALIATLVLASVLGASSARAGDEVTEGSSCQDLWVARNSIYKAYGYCFKTKRAREYFGNGDCTSDDITEVSKRLGEPQQREIERIKALEAKKGC